MAAIDALGKFQDPRAVETLAAAYYQASGSTEPAPAVGAEPAVGDFAALAGLPYGEARAALLARFEKAYLGALLDRCDGNVSRAAREARMDRSHLVDLLRRHGLR